MSRPAKTTYKTTNWKSYNQALRQRGSLTVWFDPSMQWQALPSGRRGRQQSYSDAAIQACLTLKVLLGLPLRQATGFVASLLELSGLGWSVPDFSTLSRRQKALDVSIPYRGSKGALHLLVDSTGIKVEGEGEWHTRKHPSHTCKHMLPAMGGSRRRVWRKIHLGIDEETLEIRAVEVTSSNIGDAPMLPDLLAQPAARRRSFRRGGLRGLGSRTRPEPGRETRSCERQSTWVGRCGETGADITAAAGWRRK